MVGRVGLLRHHGTHSGEDVTKSATKALQGGISDGKKARNINDSLCALRRGPGLCGRFGHFLRSRPS